MPLTTCLQSHDFESSFTVHNFANSGFNSNQWSSYSEMSSPVWFITGCSSGFGAGLARTALRAGHRVIVTARNPSKSLELVAEIESLGGNWMTLDVCAPNTKNIVEEAIAIYGKIDVFVNNAGYSAIGAFEDFEHVFALFLKINRNPKVTCFSARPSFVNKWKPIFSAL